MYYSTDIVFYELERMYRGHAEIGLCVQSLLDKSPGWVYSQDGVVLVNHNLGILPWKFGPEDQEAVVRGRDIIIVEEGKIKVLYVLIEEKTAA
jgi:hypothetical protein